MKYYCNTSAGNIEISYNNIPYKIIISEFVINMINHINENFNDISHFNSENQIIRFNNIEIRSFTLKIDSHRFYIKTNLRNIITDYKKYITKDEYEHLRYVLFVEMEAKFLDENNKDDENLIGNIIDPIKKDAKKYNI